MQYGCMNFHAKRGGEPKLSLTIKNKLSVGWTKSWFYCRVPCLHSSEGGKSMYALHSQMSTLDYVVEPEVDCPDDDPNDASFVRATATIGVRDVVEEFSACKMYPLASGFGFKAVTVGSTPMSKVQTPLPMFSVEAVSTESASCILAEVETEAERILGSLGLKEYDALSMVKLPNGGCLNHVFEQMGLAYASRPLPRTEAFLAAKEKCKVEVSKKLIPKKAKIAVIQAAPSYMVLPRKISVVKMVQLRVRLRLQHTLEIELALLKLVGVSNFFFLLDALFSSRGRRGRGAHVVAFNNLGNDSSLDVREAPLPQESEEYLPPPPLVHG
jgi:hypothetical protein